MSESGFTQFPSTPKLPERTERLSNGEEEPRARISRLPRDLESIRTTTRVRGEVVESRRDARTNETTVRIRTNRGDIEVRLPSGQRPPQSGQQVDVEIQANREQNRPPEHATIRPVEERHAERPPPPQVTTTGTTTEQRPTSTPVNVQVDTPPPPPRVTIDPPHIPPNTTPRTDVIPGDIVRLVALTPQETANIQPPPPSTVINAAVIPAAVEAPIVATIPPAQNINDAILIPKQELETIHQAPNINNSIRSVSSLVTLLNLNQTTALQADVKLSLPSIKGLTTAQILGRSPAARPELNPATPQLPAQVLAEVQPAFVTRPTDGLQTLGASAPNSFTGSLDVKIETIAPPAAHLSSPQATAEHVKLDVPGTQALILNNQKPGTLTGVVTGQTLGSLPVLNLFLPQSGESLSFTLQSPADNLTSGTQIQITPQTSASIGNAASGAVLPPFSTYLTPATWSVMEDIYQALLHNAPQTAQAFSNILPNAANPGQITPAALFFIAAVRGMDINGWLGDKALDTLRRSGHSGSVNRLSQEGSLLSRLNAEPISQEWRAISLPMFHDGEIQKIALYYKQDQHSNSDDQQQGKHTRFIFDLNLDNMGKVQLDGLFQGQRLDIILRTESTFSQAIQADMRQTYAQALRQTQVTGELSFQNQPEQWVTIQVKDEESFGAEA